MEAINKKPQIDLDIKKKAFFCKDGDWFSHNSTATGIEVQSNISKK